MIIVVDASITIARVHPHEVTPLIRETFEMVANDGAWAPPLWKAEVANVLQIQVRRKRYGVLERDEYLRHVASLNVRIDTSPDRIWSTAIDLAHRHTLSVYDAIYLELAIRQNLPLATLDADLRTAATNEGVQLFG